MNDKNLKYALYMRKSSESDDRQALSLDAQKDALSKIVKQERLNVVVEFQESKSASKPHNRPMFDEMLELVQKNKVNAILCWQVNRLSRNPEEGGKIHQLLLDEKIKIIRTTSGIHKPEDNSIGFTVELGMGTQYTRELSSNVKRGMRKANILGGINGVAPHGYLNTRINNHGSLMLDPERWRLIRKMFEMYLTGNYSVPEIRNAMNNDWGFLSVKRTKTGGKPLALSSVYSMLKNPIYMGCVRDLDDKEKLYKGDWQPIISEDEYNRIQHLLYLSGYGPQVNSHNQYELKGVFCCGECGCSITGERKTRQLKNGEAHIYTYYHCTHKRQCSQRGVIREEELFTQIEDLLKQYQIDNRLYEWALSVMNDIAKKELSERLIINSTQDTKIETLEKRYSKLLDMATNGLIDDETFKQKAAELNTLIKQTKKVKQELDEKLQNWYEVIGATLKWLNRYDDSSTNSAEVSRRNMIHSLGYNLQIIDKKITLTPYKWLEPIKKFNANSKHVENKVITDPDKGSNRFILYLKSTWQGRQELNPYQRFWRPLY